MALTAKQTEIVEKRIPLHHVCDEAQQGIDITLSPRELRFVLGAIAHFRDSQCSTEGKAGDCDLMYWYEAAQGQIERACEHYCDQLLERLIAQIPEHR